MNVKSLKRKLVSCVSAMTISASALSVQAAADWVEIGCLGDLNADKQVTVADLVILAQHLTKQQVLTNDNTYSVDYKWVSINYGDSVNNIEYLQTADMNQDGIIDAFDLVILRQTAISQQTLPVFVYYDEEPEETTTTTEFEVTTTTETTVTIQTTTETNYQIETTVTTVTDIADDYFIDAPIKAVEAYLPSQNTGNLVIFYVDFPDCQYDYSPTEDELKEIAFGAEDTSDKNYPFDSMTAFYNRSSKGIMKLQGTAFRYTAKESVSAYGSDKNKLLKECYEAFKDSDDFSKYDGDGDGYIDATLLTVPTSAGDDDWWPCAGPSGSAYKVDNMNIGHLITGNAQIVSATDYTNFNSSYLHEMGHCMGLPDYYLYSKEDYEGMHGVAGNELMDVDATTDFSAVSKLQLGWYKKSQIQVYDSSQGSQTFTLNNAQKDSGNCVIIPYGSIDDNYQSEYFIIEYQTKQLNNSNPAFWQQTADGIHVYHVNAEIYDNSWWVSYKYASGSEFTNNDDGVRFIRIIDDVDGNNYYTTGDVIDSSISGFNWYDSNGNQTIDPNVTITVGENSGDTYTITISKK